MERPFRPKAPNDRLLPGTILTREYQGNQVQVTVLDRGFEYEGEIYRSLSAVARAVTRLRSRRPRARLWREES